MTTLIRYTILHIAALLVGMCCVRTASAQSTDSAARGSNMLPGKFQFERETHNFGQIPEGPVAECDFVFTNVGGLPINIALAVGTCGCTVPKWPKEPILPGKKGSIHVVFTTVGHPGAINKAVNIKSDAEQQPMTIRLSGFVVPATNTGPASPSGH